MIHGYVAGAACRKVADNWHDGDDAEERPLTTIAKTRLIMIMIDYSAENILSEQRRRSSH